MSEKKMPYTASHPTSVEKISAEDMQKIQALTDSYYESTQMRKAEHILREFISKYITIAFLILNFLVFALISIIFFMDCYFIYYQIPSERIVGEKIIIALVTSTTVQLGVMVVGMGAWLFPRSKKDT